MYQVVKLYGDLEPWWLLDGWQEDIVECENFDTYQDALSYYQREWEILAGHLSEHKDKSEQMSAFWDPKDQRWCEECDEYLQQYHSLFILNRVEAIEELHQKSARFRQCRMKFKKS